MRLALAAVLAICLGGCKAPLVLSDPTAQAVVCGVTNIVLGPLEGLAVALGLPLWVVEDLYGTACAEAAKAGMTQDQAEKYGLEHARVYGMQLHRMRAQFAAERPVAP